MEQGHQTENTRPFTRRTLSVVGRGTTPNEADESEWKVFLVRVGVGAR